MDHQFSTTDSCQIEAWIIEAKQGSTAALGQLIDACRKYLLAIANQSLPEALRAKVGASDLVQETALEAHQDFASFTGQQSDELMAWMRRILLNNAANVNRHYQNTRKRSLSRERPLDGQGDSGFQLADHGPTASAIVANSELRSALDLAIEQLPPDMRTAIVLRNREHLSFAEVGTQMQRSAESARKLWVRGIERLQEELRRAGQLT